MLRITWNITTSINYLDFLILSVKTTIIYLTYDIFGLDVQILASQVYHGNGETIGYIRK